MPADKQSRRRQALSYRIARAIAKALPRAFADRLAHALVALDPSAVLVRDVWRPGDQRLIAMVRAYHRMSVALGADTVAEGLSRKGTVEMIPGDTLMVKAGDSRPILIAGAAFDIVYDPRHKADQPPPIAPGMLRTDPREKP